MEKFNFQNPVLRTTKEIIEKAKEVKINLEKLKEVVQKWSKKHIKIPAWPKKFHLQTKDNQKMLEYLFILDSLNFCFWSKKEKWKIFFQGKYYDGYFALALILKIFFEKYPQKTTLDYFSNISFHRFQNLLAGKGELLLLKERWKIVKKISKKLLKLYDGKIENFIISANQKFSILVPKIVKELPFFDDLSFFNQKKIYFLKRAQILAADIFGAFNGRGIGYFKDPEYLTAFADYKLPQILSYLEILEYSQKLKEKIKKRILIPAGSREEIEIRSATIWAVEYIKEVLRKKGIFLFSFQIDWILWQKSQKLNKNKLLPHHLTKTIFY